MRTLVLLLLLAADWDVLGRLHEKGFIGDPVGKTKSVTLTPEGLARSRELFDRVYTFKLPAYADPDHVNGLDAEAPADILEVAAGNQWR